MQPVQPMAPSDLVMLIAGVSIIFAAIIFAVSRALSRKRLPSAQETAAHEEAIRALNDALPRCVCGEPATDPAPQLRWDRGAFDWLRSIFAAPPRFKRIIDHMMPPTLCKHHARVADAMLDEWLFKQRSRYSEINSKIAIEAATFEQESLLRQLSESLTDSQKRAMRKSSSPPLRVVSPRTGTDDSPAASEG